MVSYSIAIFKYVLSIRKDPALILCKMDPKSVKLIEILL